MVIDQGIMLKNVEKLKTPVEMLAKMQVEKRPKSTQNLNGKISEAQMRQSSTSSKVSTHRNKFRLQLFNGRLQVSLNETAHCRVHLCLTDRKSGIQGLGVSGTAGC